MLRTIWKLTKSLLLFGLVLLAITACVQQTSPSNATQTGNTGNKLVVYIVGFGEHLSSADAAKNSGYGYEGTFYSQGKVQPYLQATSEFKNAQSLVFSYGGFTGDGKPDQFTCADTYNLKLIEDVNSLQTQIGAYLQKHPKTVVYLIGHSLGGVIAFAYMEQLIENTHSTSLLNGGQLKGVAILDSPLNGVSSAGGYENGGSPYPTQLVIDSVNGNTFTGVYGIAGPGNSPEPIQNGQINGNIITFTTPTQVESIVATYKGTISGNTITGTWSYPGGENGTFTVTKET